MTLEYFADGFEGGPLLLLHGGQRPERVELYRVFESLAAGKTREVRLHELPFVKNACGCTFTAESTDVNRGVVHDTSEAAFRWQLTPESWSHVAGLLETLAVEPGGGFQYLNDAEGPEVIYSTSRAW